MLHIFQTIGGGTMKVLSVLWLFLLFASTIVIPLHLRAQMPADTVEVPS